MYPLNSSPCFFGSGYTRKEDLLSQIRQQLDPFNQVSVEPQNLLDHEALFEQEMVARQAAHDAKMARLRQEFIYSKSLKNTIQESKHKFSLVSCDSVELTSVSPILVLAPHPKEHSSFGTQIGGQIHSLSPAISVQSSDAEPSSLSIEPPILRNKPCYVRPLSPESLSISSVANSVSKPFIALR